MRIKITLDNNEVINSELNKVNGKASSFTVACTKQVVEIAAAAEKKLSVLPKSMRKGAVAMYRPAGPSANSYKYSAKSTRIYLERGASDWFLTNVQPDSVNPRSPEVMAITINPAQADEIKRRAIEPFSVLPY